LIAKEKGVEYSFFDMVILGIDPGTVVTGYGLIRLEKGAIQLIDFGVIRPPAKLALQDRYQILFESLEALIGRHHPEAVAVESQFVMKNVQSALKLGMAKGMVYLAAARKKIPVTEYAPKQAKLAVVGNGQGSKYQVQKMIQALFHLPNPPDTEDAADALALAIAHAHASKRSPLCTSRSQEFSRKKSPIGRSLKREASVTESPSP
jgi:crossover junction endodeoxyribonuclease RuvC